VPFSGFAGIQKIGTVYATDADRSAPNNDVTYAIAPTTEFTISGDGTITNTVNTNNQSKLNSLIECISITCNETYFNSNVFVSVCFMPQ